ncbi:MAG: hypothetical protein JNL08_20625 [Planctomycetes bacterium]|nr:hypothetical protein [Planctomycetota bacterium]
MPTRCAAEFPFALICLAATALAQEGVPAPPGLVPEQMWPAPTAADWQKPVPIRWQRSWDDAVRLAQATQRPILVCVNMDGEIASEHYAGIRYRDPEIAKLYEPYVCVIASVYRHNPRDYDEQGRRIPCPRFGCVTCGEHIALEPIVYEKFLDGKRIAPRHIMVELDGSESYDVFYTWDVKSVLDRIEQGIRDRPVQAAAVVRGDRSLVEKLRSPDSRDRDEVEATFAEADAAQRRALLEAALAAGELAPIELLRLAAWGLDPALAQAARRGMLQAKDPGAVDLIADTLRAPLLAEERQQLVQALGRFGATSPRARTLATAHQGFAEQSAIDAQKWRAALQAGTYEPAPIDVDTAGTAQSRDAALAARPDDPAARLDVAEASLLQALAVAPAGARGGTRQAERARQLLLADAERETAAAIALGAGGWRPAALRAVAALQAGRRAEAFELAAQAAPDLPPDAPGQLAMEVLTLFAWARQEAIREAVRNRQEWPPQWTADVHTTYAVLSRHPFGRDTHVADHYDFLQFFGAADTDAVLDRGLERFPASAALHQRLRARLLERGGPDALEAEYARRLGTAGAPPELPWFAGYAALCAAEAHRRAARPEAAVAAYWRGLAHYERYRSATGRTDGRHYEAMALFGIARVQLEAEALPACLESLRRGFALEPLAGAAVDGLAVTGVQTADMLRARARTLGQQELAARVDALLRDLPPAALEPPEYERASRGAGNRARR